MNTMKKQRNTREWLRRGLTWEECKQVAAAQDWKCPLTGFPFILDEDQKKILDGDPQSKKKQWVIFDHDHKTGLIRGFLSDMGNMALGGYERGRYGQMRMSPDMLDYLESDFVKKTLGRECFFSK